MKNPKLTQETEVLRAFRLTKPGIEKMTDGELMGTFNRVVVELSARDKSTVIIEYLRRQADLLETSPERQAAPRKKKHPWRVYQCGKPQAAKDVFGEKDMPRRIHEGKPAKRRPAERSKTLEIDKALDDTAEVMAEAVMTEGVLPDEGESPIERHDRKAERERIRDAVEDEMEKGTKQAREQERFESDIIALAERWQA
jgi:hypothetical protein